MLYRPGQPEAAPDFFGYTMFSPCLSEKCFVETDLS